MGKRRDNIATRLAVPLRQAFDANHAVITGNARPEIVNSICTGGNAVTADKLKYSHLLAPYSI